MNRWIDARKEYGESPKVEAFCRDLVELCRRHGFSFSQDMSVIEWNDRDANWLLGLPDGRGKNT